MIVSGNEDAAVEYLPWLLWGISYVPLLSSGALPKKE